MNTSTIFIVDDDPWFTEFLEYHIKMIEEPKSVVKFKTGSELLKKLKDKPDIITLDYSLPDFNGKQLLAEIKDKCPDCYVVVVSGQNDLNLAVELLKEGAYDYILKDNDTQERIWRTFRSLYKIIGLNQEVQGLKEALHKNQVFGETIIGESKAIKDLFPLLDKAAGSQINVSIFGETGTGKELVAKYIHETSDKTKKPFVAINLGAIPKDLAESELFGHEKGAFTGALESRKGKFEEAGDGTIFLDEIGELEPILQVKLLRVLQEREITRVGSNKPVKIKCRIICATHRDLEKEVVSGRFREDLFYRLIGLTVELPPLRKRSGDIILLSEYFIRLGEGNSGKKTKKLSDSAKTKLLNHPFPGNVRELRSVIELALVLSDEQTIDESHIRLRSLSSPDILNDSNMTIHEMTMYMIHRKMEKYNQDTQRVADELGIGKSTIYRLLKEEREKNTL